MAKRPASNPAAETGAEGADPNGEGAATATLPSSNGALRRATAPRGAEDPQEGGLQRPPAGRRHGRRGGDRRGVQRPRRPAGARHAARPPGSPRSSARRAGSPSGPTLGAATGAWADRIDSINTLIGDLVQPTEEVARVIGAVAKGDLSQRIPLEHDGTPAPGRVPPDRPDRQHDGRPARLVRLRSDPRRPRGRHRGQARRPGRGQGGRRHLEGPDRQRQQHGRQPHRPGPQHRPGHHRRRQRRPLEEDHRRRQGRDPRAEGHHQHDGRPARLVRLRGDPRRPRGRHRGPARRPGRGRAAWPASGRT